MVLALSKPANIGKYMVLAFRRPQNLYKMHGFGRIKARKHCELHLILALTRPQYILYIYNMVLAFTRPQNIVKIHGFGIITAIKPCKLHGFPDPQQAWSSV